jgi:acetoacetyl-CoA synthetase
MNPLWLPDGDRVRNARITQYLQWLQENRGLSFGGYADLWEWSTADPGAFWHSIWCYFDVVGDPGPGPWLSGTGILDARWFPCARLNYVDQIFRCVNPTQPAVIAADETGASVEVSWLELRRRVAALARTLREQGIGRGDKVAAYLPNRIEAVVAFLATASIGAVWSLCSTDMGSASVLDRFRQIKPAVLIASGGYRFGGREFDRQEIVDTLRAELSAKLFIPVHMAQTTSGPGSVIDWESATSGEATLTPVSVEFDHPLWIVYSSGTTGLPKPIVHGHGGVVLEHLKLTALHNDLGTADRFLWYSNSGWIMWNLQVAGLLVGATICLYDGSPGWPKLEALWQFADRVGVTFFGSGAAFYQNCMKAGIELRARSLMKQLRSIGSTGSPLSAQAYEWLQRECGPHVWITPICGGTDIASAFLGGVCILPVHAGEMQCRCLGAGVESWNESGRPVVDEVGELVCTMPMPSMPLYLINDPDGSRLKASYFEHFPGIWRQGDWVELNGRGGAIVYGRSDATINRQGVRVGTSELYRAVESVEEVSDSLVVDLEYLGRDSYMPLFVVLKPGVFLDEEMMRKIYAAIRSALSPKYLPNEVFAIPEVPKTLSGKKLEVPIKRLLLGEALERVVNTDALANPGSLAWFREFAQRRSQALSNLTQR